MPGLFGYRSVTETSVSSRKSCVSHLWLMAVDSLHASATTFALEGTTVRRTSILASQQLPDGARAIAEDSIQLSPYQRQHEKACGRERQAILHAIGHPRTLLVLDKRVQVPPAPVRPADLFVDKLITRLPLNNPCAPVEGHSEEPQTIVDDCPFPDIDRGRRQDSKSEFRRRNAFQVFGVGEKSKHFINCSRQYRGRFQKLTASVRRAV
jgi:hypothetical protein